MDSTWTSICWSFQVSPSFESSQLGSECGSCFVLWFGLQVGLSFGPSWASNVDLGGVDFGLTWPALVWGLIFGLKSWSECWFEIGLLLAQSLGLRSEFGKHLVCIVQNLFKLLVWSFGLDVVWVPWGRLKACLSFGLNFDLRLVSGLVCGEKLAQTFSPRAYAKLDTIYQEGHWANNTERKTVLWSYLPNKLLPPGAAIKQRGSHPKTGTKPKYNDVNKLVAG